MRPNQSKLFDAVVALFVASEPVAREFKREPLASAYSDDIIVEIPMTYGEMRAFVAAYDAVKEIA